MTPSPGAEEPRSDGLRARKKERTRLAIEDAALVLFAEHGYEATTIDQIAERAEISKTTFFRYFASKGDVIFNTTDRYQPLRQAVTERPAHEDDLTAVRRALRGDWARTTMEPERAKRQALAAGSSARLRGLSFDMSLNWEAAVSQALAHRRGLAEPDRQCELAATIALGVLTNAVRTWLRNDCEGDFLATVDEGFDLLPDFQGEASAPPSATT